MNASTIVRDAHVITMTRATGDSDAQAIALDGDTIAAVGSNAEIDVLAAPGTEVMSLAGKTVLPGFIDTHFHLMHAGLSLLGPTAAGVTSADAVVALVADAGSRMDPGQALVVYGYDAGTMDRPVTRLDLDRAVPGRAVTIRDVGGHASIVNSLALQRLELPEGAVGVRRLSTGEPSGMLVAVANRIAAGRAEDEIPDATRVAALHRAAGHALTYGITTIHALEGRSGDGQPTRPEIEARVLLQEQSRLPAKTLLYFQSTDVRRAREWNLPCIGGCVLVDGAYGEHTAALMEPYTDDPSTRGVLYFTDEELNAFVERAHLAGLQISMHAIGDAAIEQLLNAYERVLTLYPKADHRHRIEHFSLPMPQHIERAARLGVAAAMQPNFALMPETGAQDDYQFANARFLGPERAKRRHPYRTIQDAGILIAGGSDADAGELGPLLGIHAVVNHPDEVRRLTVFEALALYTANAAKIGFEEGVKGTIEPGKQADLVVLGDNPLTVDSRNLKQIPVLMSIVGGEVAYRGGTH